MKRYIYATLTIFVIALASLAVVYDIIPTQFWSLNYISDPNYSTNLKKEWLQKPSSFLLLKLYSIDPMRFGLASYILGQRKESLATSALVMRVRSHYVGDQIHLSACSALAQISPSIAKNELTKIVENAKNIKNHNSREYNRYENALRILSTLKDERAYPIILRMAKSGTSLEKQVSFHGMLYYFDNHWQEILPLYLNYLTDADCSRLDALKALKYLGRPEAIPVLENFALNNRAYEQEAKETIEYLKELKK